jgi:hypothetical protein
MGSVSCRAALIPLPMLMSLAFRSGLWKERALVSQPFDTFVLRAYNVDQLHNNRRRQDYD